MDFADRTSFGKIINSKKYLNQNKKFKILICSHDFFDSPHLYGNFLFPDFYEWLKYLSKLSLKTDYDWYVKNHPSYGGKFKIYQRFTDTTVQDIFLNHPKIKLLENNISHKQLMKEGINAVLTVYGTVAMEYSYFNIPVINAGINNPHVAYNFSKSVSNIKQYEEIIKKIHKKNYKINKKEIEEYYCMRHLFINDQWFLKNYLNFYKKIGGYHNLRTVNVYKFAINYMDQSIKKYIFNNLSNFLLSNDNNICAYKI
jgi:hypothetical protein